ncbi:hypothetical protein ASG25_21165 [Rhizobium sp. Leaf384]|nr:hypothetical protein ASG25_21165 [Rhizobium sp. Leaf384]
MQALEGRSAILRMGIEDGQRSVDTGNDVYLFCHTLDFDLEASSWMPQLGPYTATCVAETWSGKLSFTPDPEAEQRLILLRNAVAEQVTATERDSVFRRIALVIAPLALFLILSAAYWMISRATAFVCAG